MSIVSDILNEGFKDLLKSSKENVTINGVDYSAIVSTMWPNSLIDVSGSTESYSLSLKLEDINSPFPVGTIAHVRDNVVQVVDCIKKKGNWQITLNNAHFSPNNFG